MSKRYISVDEYATRRKKKTDDKVAVIDKALASVAKREQAIAAAEKRIAAAEAKVKSIKQGSGPKAPASPRIGPKPKDPLVPLNLRLAKKQAAAKKKPTSTKKLKR